MKQVNLHITSWRGISIGANHWYGELLWTVDKERVDGSSMKTHRLSKKLTASEARELRKLDGQWNWSFKWCAGMKTERLDSEDEVIELAIAEYKKHCLDAGILVLGDYATSGPHLVLDGPPEFVKKAANLYKQAEAIGWWDRDLEKMRAISDRWEKLKHAFGVEED